MLDTTLHEIFHVLGFSFDNIAEFIDPGTLSPYANINTIVGSATLRSITYICLI